MATKVFTEDEKKVLFDAAHRTWDYVGYDCLQAVAEENPKKEPVMSRAAVLEMVIDANRLEDTLRQMKQPALEAKVRRVLDGKGGYALLCKVLTETFTFARYGM